jgi:hypothetical protein
MEAIKRFKEPSTWGAIGALLMAFGVITQPEAVLVTQAADTVLNNGEVIVGAIMSVFAVFMPERGGK